MSKEVFAPYESGHADLYFVRYNSIGQVALTDGSVFEDWGTGGRDADYYDVALAEVGSGGVGYVGDFDASSNIAAGRYKLAGFIKSGANPADGDLMFADSKVPFVWNGTVEVFVINTAGRIDLGKWLGVAPLALVSQYIQTTTKAVADAIQKLLRADKVIDTAKTPWVTDYKEEGTEDKLMSKTMKNAAGENITNINNVLGRSEQE